jgi:hypothetical protein
MKAQNETLTNETASSQAPSLLHRLGLWIQEPMGSVVAASAATMSTLAFVLSGMWLINLALG